MAKIVKAIFDATSPTVQYGNVHTIVEVEGDNWDEIRDLGLSRIAEVDEMVSPTPFRLKPPRTAPKNIERITSRLTGVTLNYDRDAHIYTGLDGRPYESGSKFPERFYEPMDTNRVIEQIKRAYPDSGITAEQLLDMWETNASISKNFGNAVHAAIENYIKYHKVGDLIHKDGDHNKALSKNKLFSGLVHDYETKFGVDGLLSEEFIADNSGHCGRVDAIKVLDKDNKVVRIIDFKTDSDLFEKRYQKKDSPFKATVKENTLLTYHRFQMSYYAYILKQFGYTVDGLDLDWFNPSTLEWERHSVDVIDLTDVLKEEK